MAIDHQRHRLEEARKRGLGIGLLKSMGVTFKHLFKRARANVIEYPDEKQDLAPRTRGVIALKEENCTVCMLCGRECPDWCIYIDSHKETLPPKREGGRPRKRNVLDRFAIDFALCMYCGICVDVCPYDALFWSREFEFAEYDIREMTHEKERLSDWMETVLPPPALEEGALLPGTPPPEAPAVPKAPTAAPAAARVEAPQAPAEPAALAATAETQVEEKPAEPAPAEPAEPAAQAPAEPAAPPKATVPEPKAEAAPAPKEDAATAQLQRAAPGVSQEEAQAVYEQVLKEQLGAGASPQVAEARAKVAKVKAERGIGRPPTPVEVDKPVPSAPTKHEVTEEPAEPAAQPPAEPAPQPPAEPAPPGAPRAEEPQPEQGPVTPTDDEKEK